MNLREFLAMGGYGLYVWTSYGLVFFVLACNWVATLRRHRELLRGIRRQRKRESRP
jgi:heme exporter protein D